MVKKLKRGRLQAMNKKKKIDEPTWAVIGRRCGPRTN